MGKQGNIGILYTSQSPNRQREAAQMFQVKGGQRDITKQHPTLDRILSGQGRVKSIMSLTDKIRTQQVDWQTKYAFMLHALINHAMIMLENTPILRKHILKYLG